MAASFLCLRRLCGAVVRTAMAGLLPALAHAQLLDVFAGAPDPEQAQFCSQLPAGVVAENCRRVLAAPALTFPAELRVDQPVKLEMAIHVPAGPGPFPAIVLLHTCASLTANPQVKTYAQAALRAGYAVFIVDSWSQRKMPDGFCEARPDSGPVLGLRIRDAAQALDHLRRFAAIDIHRVAALGFSQGARAVYWLARDDKVPPYTQAKFYTHGKADFAALVAMYGECYNRALRANWLGEHHAVPLLALLGERDEDGDPQACVPRMEKARAAGSPLEWHVFPGAGHSWDDETYTTWRSTPYPPARSGQVLQAYDPQVTAQAQQLSLDFLARVMKRD